MTAGNQDESTRPVRDRDAAGRARNARSRDAMGRPLPRGESGIERIPDDLVLGPEQTLAEAQRLLDEGLPFNAHEVLEGRWKSAPAEERDLWQGLAQLAVGLTHLQRGNAVGARTLLLRGAARISPYAGPLADGDRATPAGHPPYEIDVDGLVSYARSLAEVVGSSGIPDVPPEPPGLFARLPKPDEPLE